MSTIRERERELGVWFVISFSSKIYTFIQTSNLRSYRTRNKNRKKNQTRLATHKSEQVFLSMIQKCVCVWLLKKYKKNRVCCSWLFCIGLEDYLAHFIFFLSYFIRRFFSLLFFTFNIFLYYSIYRYHTHIYINIEINRLITIIYYYAYIIFIIDQWDWIQSYSFIHMHNVTTNLLEKKKFLNFNEKVTFFSFLFLVEHTHTHILGAISNIFFIIIINLVGVLSCCCYCRFFLFCFDSSPSPSSSSHTQWMMIVNFFFRVSIHCQFFLS